MMLVATLLFTVMDSIAKSLTASYPVQQVIWARYFFQFALMLLLIPRLGISGLLWTRRPGVHITRGLLLTVATGCMITAISMVPLLPFVVDAPASFQLSIVMTGVVFFLIGSGKSRWSPVSWWRSGCETLAIGMGAAALAYVIGYGLKTLV